MNVELTEEQIDRVRIFDRLFAQVVAKVACQVADQVADRVATEVAGQVAGQVADQVASRVVDIAASKFEKQKLPDALTTKEVAKYIGLKAKTVRSYVTKKDFPLPRKIGRMFSFDRKEVEAWMKRKSKESFAIYRP